MIDRRLELTLSQIGDAIRKMRDFAEGMTFEDYRNDAKTRYAMERCVEIISEGARRIPSAIQEGHTGIPWDDIKGIGNILRHGYDEIDDRIIWGVLKRHLTALEDTLTLIAEEHGFFVRSATRSFPGEAQACPIGNCDGPPSPILDLDKAATCLFIKRSLASGYAGIDNTLFYAEDG